MEKKRFAISIWKWRSQILLLTLSEVPKYEHQGFYDLIETYESVLKTLLSKNRPIHFYPSYLFSLLLLQVRRAAAKCLEAVISTRHELLDEFYNSVSPALIGRFKEREENVKAGMYLNYQILGHINCLPHVFVRKVESRILNQFRGCCKYLSRSAFANNLFHETRILVYLLFEYLYQIKLQNNNSYMYWQFLMYLILIQNFCLVKVLKK